jgi:spoIIIJ-associated protein
MNDDHERDALGQQPDAQETEAVEVETAEAAGEDVADVDESLGEDAEDGGAEDDDAGDTDTDTDTGVEDDGDEDAEGRPSKVERLENEGEIAADYLEELLDIADLDGDLDMDVEGDRAVVSIVGADLSQLVGRDGEVLEALQELTRLAVYRETGERSRLMLDVSGHRAQRRRELEAVAATAIAEVRESGERVSLEPMSAFERKVVHDEVSAAGLVSESEGVEPRRFVVILPS